MFNSKHNSPMLFSIRLSSLHVHLKSIFKSQPTWAVNVRFAWKQKRWGRSRGGGECRSFFFFKVIVMVSACIPSFLLPSVACDIYLLTRFSTSPLVEDRFYVWPWTLSHQSLVGKYSKRRAFWGQPIASSDLIQFYIYLLCTNWQSLTIASYCRHLFAR